MVSGCLLKLSTRPSVGYLQVLKISFRSNVLVLSDTIQTLSLVFHILTPSIDCPELDRENIAILSFQGLIMAKEYTRGLAVAFFTLFLIAHADGAHIPASPVMASKAAQSCNKLGIQLYLILSSGDNNVVFSPFGLTKAIGTSKLGAQAQRKTLEELNEVLELNSRTFFNDMKKLNQEIIDKRNDGVHVEFENILLGKDDFKMRAESVNHNLQLHPGETHGNPGGQNNSMANGVNGNEVVRDLGNGGLDARMDLVNKAMFKAHWEIPFSVFKRSSFYIPGHKGFLDNEVQVDFMGLMSDENQMKYFDDEEYRCQVIELNYGKDFIGDSWDPRYSPADVSMVIVLPYEDQPLRTLEEKLTPSTTERWISKLKLTNIDVNIPKFNISTLLDATVPLQELGVLNLFTKLNSDLSANPGRESKLRSLWQEISIAASETGTEKPRVPSEDVSIMLISNPKKIFEAVRPFLFFIRDKPTNTNLFMGRVVNPNQS